MAKLLVIAFDEADAQSSAGFAKALGLPYDVLLLSGDFVPAGAEQMMRVNLGSIPAADGLAKALVDVVGGYTHIASPSSMRSKDVLAYLAGLLDAGMVTDAIAVVSPTEFKRPIYAGAMTATVKTDSDPLVITFRPSNFGKVEGGANGSETSVSLNIEGTAIILSESSRGTSRPDLSQAKIVVSGGRPLKTAEMFESVIGGFADSLGAAVGATRAAVDSGIAPNELQVGQTGKVVAPDLYIAAGISGSTQHMAGIKDSKVIIAVNTDANAPIFDAADLGIVGDLYQVLPELQGLLKQ
ncbi:MAG: FAD-binding protein [Armatimonadetes bacterium]|nr:FAD-binding protein [Armatimonadota bacterium]